MGSSSDQSRPSQPQAIEKNPYPKQPQMSNADKMSNASATDSEDSGISALAYRAKPQAMEHFSRFSIFPELPIELRLQIWDHAITALTGGPRIVEMFWINPDSVFSHSFKRPEDGSRFLLVNKESREQYLRAYKFIPRLQYPSHAPQANSFKHFFTFPQHINARLDTLFLADTLPARNEALLDQIFEAHSLDELKLLAFRVQAGNVIYNAASLARFPKLQMITASVNDSQFHERTRGGRVIFVKPTAEQTLWTEQEVAGILQAMARTRSQASQGELPLFVAKEVLRGSVSLYLGRGWGCSNLAAAPWGRYLESLESPGRTSRHDSHN